MIHEAPSGRGGRPRVMYVLGTRPNFVKMAPVIAALRDRLPRARHIVVHTGQHYDPLMSDIFMRDLRLPAPDRMLGVGSGSHAEQTARVMERLERVLVEDRPDLLVVPGDVNSTLAAALTAAKLGVRLAHVESGLRSFDRSMPEEINRVLTDRLSQLLFLHSDEAVANLRAEGIEDERIHYVGNTMIDTLTVMEERFRSFDAARAHGVRERQYLLVTLHRPALVDGPLLAEAVTRLNEVASQLPVLFPMHPRTRARLDRLTIPVRFQCTGPVGYLEFLSLEADAAAVLTDSGGVQEETTYLGVPCFTLRDNTERPVTVRIGTNTVLGLDPAGIAAILPALAEERTAPPPPPLWDGMAASRLADVVERSMAGLSSARG